MCRNIETTQLKTFRKERDNEYLHKVNVTIMSSRNDVMLSDNSDNCNVSISDNDNEHEISFSKTSNNY